MTWSFYNRRLCNNAQYPAIPTYNILKWGPYSSRVDATTEQRLGQPQQLRQPSLLCHPSSAASLLNQPAEATLIAPYLPAQRWMSTFLPIMVDSAITPPKKKKLTTPPGEQNRVPRVPQKPWLDHFMLGEPLGAQTNFSRLVISRSDTVLARLVSHYLGFL